MNLKTWTVAVFILAGTCSIKAQKIIVGTFNIRYDNPRDTGNLWKDRAPVVSSLIRFHSFDVLGIQEGLINQLEDISKALPEYPVMAKAVMMARTVESIRLSSIK